MRPSNAERWWVGKAQPTCSLPPLSSGLPIVAKERRELCDDRAAVETRVTANVAWAALGRRNPSAAATGTRGPEANPSSGPDAGTLKSREGGGERCRRGGSEEPPAAVPAQNPYRVQGARYVEPKTPKVTPLRCFVRRLPILLRAITTRCEDVGQAPEQMYGFALVYAQTAKRVLPYCVLPVQAGERDGGVQPCKFCGRAREWPRLATVPEHPRDSELLATLGVKFAMCGAQNQAELIELCSSDGKGSIAHRVSHSRSRVSRSGRCENEVENEQEEKPAKAGRKRVSWGDSHVYEDDKVQPAAEEDKSVADHLSSWILAVQSLAEHPTWEDCKGALPSKCPHPHLRADLQASPQAPTPAPTSPFSMSSILQAVQGVLSADAGSGASLRRASPAHPDQSSLVIVALWNGGEARGHGSNGENDSEPGPERGQVIACAGLTLPAAAPCSWCVAAARRSALGARQSFSVGGENAQAADEGCGGREGGERVRECGEQALALETGDYQGEGWREGGEGESGARPAMVRFAGDEDEGSDRERQREEEMRDKEARRAQEWDRVVADETIMAVAPAFKGTGLTRALCRSRWLLIPIRTRTRTVPPNSPPTRALTCLLLVRPDAPTPPQPVPPPPGHEQAASNSIGRDTCQLQLVGLWRRILLLLLLFVGTRSTREVGVSVDAFRKVRAAAFWKRSKHEFSVECAAVEPAEKSSEGVEERV